MIHKEKVKYNKIDWRINQMRFYIVDAFTEDIFGGNPAGVVLLENGLNFPDDNIMIKTAAELRYSETAFIKPLSGDQLQIRYFTPTSEVEFCGHATIGSFAALLKSGFAQRDSSYSINTLSGDLKIKISDGFIMMEMPASKLIKSTFEPSEINELYNALGIEWEPVNVTFNGENTVELLPQLISTGFPDIFVPIKNHQTLAKIAPDFKILSDLSEKHDAGGVHAFTLDAPDDGIMACTRNFAPLFGIDEEAATGTASGGLAYYLYSHGMAFDGYDYCFLQGEAMGRPSKIVASINAHPEFVEIKVGGKGAILAEGQIYL